MEGFLILIVVLALIGVIAQFVFPVIMVVGAVNQYKRFQQAIALQSRFLERSGGQLPGRPELQDEFVDGLRTAANAAQALKGQQAIAAQQQMMAMLARMRDTQPQGRWTNGAYFSGGDVVIPGGPSLIGGQLHIPR